MKKLLGLALALGAILAVVGCGGGEEPYVIEGKGMNDPSVAGTVSSDGGEAQNMAKPAAPAPPSKSGR